MQRRTGGCRGTEMLQGKAGKFRSTGEHTPDGQIGEEEIGGTFRLIGYR